MLLGPEFNAPISTVAGFHFRLFLPNGPLLATDGTTPARACWCNPPRALLGGLCGAGDAR